MKADKILTYSFSPLISSAEVIDPLFRGWDDRNGKKIKGSDPMNFDKEYNDMPRTIGGDKVFNLPLPTLVEGETPAGEAFQEKTVLNYISHQGAVLDRKSVV